MVRLVRVLHKISVNPSYRSFLKNDLPESAQADPGYFSVMMGYDFHLSESGPKLIEVNTNTGGIWYASMDSDALKTDFPARLKNELLNSFFDEFALFSKNPKARPKVIAILDEQPDQQPLYREMQVFASMFRQAGIDVVIADAERCTRKNSGLYINDRRIDMIYNRHCDFYLQTPVMEKIKNAWLNGEVCLSPNPYMYGLLADKRRMILWSQPELMKSFGLSARETSILNQTIPATRLLGSLSSEEAWKTRKHWVFKPDTGYASRGVYVGAKLTKTKFAELEPQNTVIQQRIIPTLTRGGEDEVFKTDYRLFAYRERIHCVSARIYQGQVTNLHTENGGFAKVRLVHSYRP